MIVLDTSAMMVFLKREAGAEEVRDLITGNPSCAHTVNLCEVYYLLYRAGGADEADRAIDVLRSLGVLTENDMRLETWRNAAVVKAGFPGISLADCYCAALAQLVHGEVATKDSDFAEFAEAGVCAVRFLR